MCVLSFLREMLTRVLRESSRRVQLGEPEADLVPQLGVSVAGSDVEHSARGRLQSHISRFSLAAGLSRRGSGTLQSRGGDLIDADEM